MNKYFFAGGGTSIELASRGDLVQEVILLGGERGALYYPIEQPAEMIFETMLE